MIELKIDPLPSRGHQGEKSYDGKFKHARPKSESTGIPLQPMLRSALINSPPSRFGSVTLTSDNTLNLRLGEGYLPVPTNILVTDFKKFRYGQELP